jgi:aspartate carbamoyltransferase catalytic subunit
LILGDIVHSRVALSNIYALQKLGANVKLCGPPTLIPKNIEILGVDVTYNVDEALEWCDVVNVLRIQLERQKDSYFPSLREYARVFGLTYERLSKLNKPITVMHPGPMNRGVEIESKVADHPDHSVILHQVENGVAIRMAVLYLLAANPAD